MTPVVTSDRPVVLVGGSPEAKDRLPLALRHCDRIVAADGGAAAVIAAGRMPDAVIGDMDSLSSDTRAALPAILMHPVTEQDSTDFEKCLSRIDAPMVFAVGFSGGRVDHALAVLNALVRYPRRPCILLGAEDLVMLAPQHMALDLAVGTRLSLFPMAPVAGDSVGLRWPINDLEFGPGARIGTSNEVTGPVMLNFYQPAMLLILPVEQVDAVLDGWDHAKRWS